MQITLKLYASLMHLLPEGSSRHAINIEIDSDDSPYQVIDRFKIPRDLAHLVIVNGFFVCGDAREKHVFKEGDVLAIWPPVAGG